MKSTIRIEILLFVAMFINMHAQTSAATCAWTNVACHMTKAKDALVTSGAMTASLFSDTKTAIGTVASQVASDTYNYTTESIAEKTKAKVERMYATKGLTDADCKAIIKTELDNQKEAYEKTSVTKVEAMKMFHEMEAGCFANIRKYSSYAERERLAKEAALTAETRAKYEAGHCQRTLAIARTAVRTRNCMKSVQYNMWCNYDKVLDGNLATSNGTPDECIERCIASASCGFAGLRKSDSYCEFWRPRTYGTCGNPHRVVGHDVYEVDEDCDQNTAVVYHSTAGQRKLDDDNKQRSTPGISDGLTSGQRSGAALKAGDEEEAEANVVDATPAAAATNNQPTSDAEVARTVFEGIIAIAFLYIAYTVGAKSQPESGIIANNVAEISEI